MIDRSFSKNIQEDENEKINKEQTTRRKKCTYNSRTVPSGIK